MPPKNKTRPRVREAYTGNPEHDKEYRGFMLQNMPTPPAKRKRFGDDKNDSQ